MKNNACTIQIGYFDEENFIGRLSAGIMKQTLKHVEKEIARKEWWN